MKREFAKWILDIAKYMMTALLLSYIFVDLDNPWIFAGLLVLIIILSVAGFIILQHEDSKDKKKNRRK